MSQNMNIVLNQKRVPEEEKVESKNLSSHNEELQNLENNALIMATNEEKKDVAKEKQYMSKNCFFFHEPIIFCQVRIEKLSPRSVGRFLNLLLPSFVLSFGKNET